MNEQPSRYPGRKPISRRHFLAGLGAAAAIPLLVSDALSQPGVAESPSQQPGAARPSVPASAKKRLPNFVFILADDLGYGDIGCFGAPNIRTPNLDRMAAQGAKFTEFYVAGPVCTPSRAALMTGCYPKRVGLHIDVLFPDSKTGLNPDEITLAEILRTRGYATACIGKWHLGCQAKFLPTRQGFDSYFGIPYSNDMFGKNNYPPIPLMRDEKIVEQPADQNTLTRRYTEEAVRVIEANRDRPFFLYLAHTMPHKPVHASEDFRGRGKRGLYGDAVEEIDWSCGRVLDTLQRLGLQKDTLVIFTSDNGPMLKDDLRGGSAGVLRGGKGTTWEGGMREPCVMRWPGRIPAGSVCPELATTMDILPTFAALSGAAVPTDRTIDGRNILALMEHPATAKTPHESFFYYSKAGLMEAVRSGEWKLRLDTGELFNLETDWGEMRNVAGEHADIVTRLRKLGADFDRDLEAHSRPHGWVE